MDLQSALGVKQELVETFSRHRIGLRGGPRTFALGVAPGSRSVQYQVAVRAESEEDLPPEALDEIERAAAGEVDVRYVGRIEANTTGGASATRGPAIGVSVGHFLCTAGTLGFFARRNADGSVGFVSNNHVIAAEDQGEDLDEVLHPGPADRGVRPRDVIGHLVGDYPRLKDPEPLVDCAFAKLVDGKKYDPGDLGSGQRLSTTIVTPSMGLQVSVSKIGRSTRLTRGRVSAFDLDPYVDFSFGRIRFEGQIEFEPGNDDGTPFGCGGDSGSLVFTTDGCHPVGLLFAASVLGGPTNCGLAYANPIDAVLKTLNVTMLT
jgi:hypothetical protein